VGIFELFRGEKANFSSCIIYEQRERRPGKKIPDVRKDFEEPIKSEMNEKNGERHVVKIGLLNNFESTNKTNFKE